MKCLTRILSFFLAFVLATGMLPVSVVAVGEDDLLVKRSIRVYSSVDQQRHEVQVTEQDGKIYINATDLTALLQGDVYLWQKKSGFHKFLEGENEFTELLKQGMGAVGLSTEAPYYYILQNGITGQNLRYNLASGKWTYFATESKGLAGDIRDIPELAAPIVENDIVYVELLPFAKALGIIVNIAAEGDGLSFHIPEVTMDSLAGIVSEVFSLDGGVMIPWRDDETIWEALGAETALYLDQVADVCSGELIPFVMGNYDADRFEEVMIAVLSVYGEETADYVADLWSGMEYTRSVIDTPAGLMMLAEMDNGYVEYLASLESDAKLNELIQTDSPGVSGMESATGLLVGIYSRQLCLANMVTTNVEAANNVFNGKTRWVPEESLSLTGRTTGDIVRTLVDEYYHGISGKTIKKAVMETTLEVILGQYSATEPETLEDLPIWKQCLDISSFRLGQALYSLNVIGIALQAYEAHSGYQYGTLHQVAAYRELQDLLNYGYINCLNSSSEDLAAQAQYIFDCAKLAFLAKLAYSPYTGNKTGPLCDKLFSINPQEVVLSTAESIEALSGANDDEIRPLIFDNASYEFDFWDFADAMGMDPYRTDGTFGIGNSVIGDFDLDGYPEYLMSVSDERLYPTPFYALLDADAGRVAVNTIYNEYGLEAQKFPVWNPETGHLLLRTAIHTQWEDSEYYECWNGQSFEQFARAYRHAVGLKTDYSGRFSPDGYEILSEYQYEKRIEGYSDTPYTGWEVEVGSDQMQKTGELLEAIRRAVPVVKEDAVDNRLDPSQVFKVDGVQFNQDRSIINIDCSWVTPWEVKKANEGVQWWEPYACYYIDVEGGEILRIIVPDGPPFPEDEDWLTSHGF